MANILKETISELELEEDLKKQLSISFLNEEQGIFPGAKEMADKLCSYCMNYITDINNAVKSNDKRFYVFNINLPKQFFGKNVFFHKIKCFIKIYLLKDKTPQFSYKDLIKFEQSLKNDYDPWFFNVKDNKLEDVVINLACAIKDKNDLRKKLPGLFMHEMTHAYENLQRILKNGGYGLLDYASQSQYGNKNSLISYQDKSLTIEEYELINRIKYILYFISKPEINAKLSEFYSEIRNVKLDNINQASKIIYDSEIWKQIKAVYQAIIGLEFASFACNEDSLKKILNIFNEKSERKYPNFDAFIKSLDVKFSFIKNELFKKMAKLVYRAKIEQEELNNPKMEKNLMNNA